MKPSNVPTYAIPVPPPRGPFPTEQIDQINSIKQLSAKFNAVDKSNWQAKCDAWKIESLHSREYNLPDIPKPQPPVIQVFMAAPDDDPTTSIIWVWNQDQTLAPCPNLPPVQTSFPAGVIHVLHRAGPVGSNTIFFDAAEDDTYANSGSVPVKATSDDGVFGVFRPYGYAFGHGYYVYLGPAS